MAATMSPRGLLLLVLLTLALSICLGVSPGNWGCANYRGYCRAACFPQENSLGPKDCAEGFVYVPLKQLLPLYPSSDPSTKTERLGPCRVPNAASDCDQMEQTAVKINFNMGQPAVCRVLLDKNSFAQGVNGT